MVKFLTYEDMANNVILQDGETYQDILTLQDAQKRYGISRTALRDAAMYGKIYARFIGGQSKKILYMRRADIIKYILLPQSKSKAKRPVPWRQQDTKPKIIANEHQRGETEG
ncbi:MAG: hypothetical protein EBR94_01035 [Bacteroidetes bacterium]|nr:hypothetical protein [Bacteroidota bacterium]